jgi:hypothetical protein
VKGLSERVKETSSRMNRAAEKGIRNEVVDVNGARRNRKRRRKKETKQLCEKFHISGVRAGLQRK